MSLAHEGGRVVAFSRFQHTLEIHVTVTGHLESSIQALSFISCLLIW